MGSEWYNLNKCRNKKKLQASHIQNENTSFIISHLTARRMNERYDTYIFKLLQESFHFRETRQPLHHLVEAGRTIFLRYIIFQQFTQSFQLFSCFDKFIHYLSTRTRIYRLLIYFLTIILLFLSQLITLIPNFLEFFALHIVRFTSISTIASPYITKLLVKSH